MKIHNTCRVCGGGLTPVLSLGDLYISDFPLPAEPDGLRAPLELVLCRRCHLLQLRHTVPAEALYRNYWYRSGTNRTMQMALADIANQVEVLAHLQEGEAVLDIGCNDGTLLSTYKTGGIFKIGFDPAQNLTQYAQRVADRVIPDFFSAHRFGHEPQLAARRPRVVTSIAMFYDLEDPNRFVGDIKAVMDPAGVWVVQMSYLPLMLKQNEIGNVCHEHLEYYSLLSFESLLHRHQLEVVDVELNDINGGSLRAYVRSVGASPETFGDATYRALAAERVQALREQEVKMRLDEVETYAEFAMWIERIKADVTGFIQAQTDQGKKVYVYGASTKGNTVLQYFGLDHTLITAAAERNPDKWGRLTVGTRIPIVSEAAARAAHPDFFLVLPWHFIEEFQMREKPYLLRGGRFIMPAPYFSLR